MARSISSKWAKQQKSSWYGVKMPAPFIHPINDLFVHKRDGYTFPFIKIYGLCSYILDIHSNSDSSFGGDLFWPKTRHLNNGLPYRLRSNLWDQCHLFQSNSLLLDTDSPNSGLRPNTIGLYNWHNLSEQQSHGVKFPKWPISRILEQ